MGAIRGSDLERGAAATVSGSFRLAMGAVQDAVYRLTDSGVRVLSPADPRVVDQLGDFVFVASDRARIIKLVQSRHLAAISASDFLWVVAPNGYIGQSGALEIGFALSAGTPVFSSEVPADLTLRQYVTALPYPEDALRAVQLAAGGRTAVDGEVANVLLDPEVAIRSAHDHLDAIAGELLSGRRRPCPQSRVAATKIYEQVVGPLDLA
jgi:hypothetical protein